MELEGRKELVDTGKSSRTWSLPSRFPLVSTPQNCPNGRLDPNT